MKQTCANCRYYEESGICVRYPAQVVFDELGHTQSMFPEAYSCNWCGEWKEKEKKDTKPQET